MSAYFFLLISVTLEDSTSKTPLLFVCLFVHWLVGWFFAFCVLCRGKSNLTIMPLLMTHLHMDP